MNHALSAGAFAAMFLAAVPASAISPQDVFFRQLAAHCGKAFEGRVTTTDAADADFASARLVMHVRDCTDDVIRIPFHVGENRSRTWVISRTADGLRLKHDHRHEDGSEDKVTQYGGDTADAGTTTRQEFPVDEFSKALFEREGRPASVTNVWAVEVDGSAYTYELKRENRHLRVTFDLSKPVDLPPPVWGYQPAQ